MTALFLSRLRGSIAACIKPSAYVQILARLETIEQKASHIMATVADVQAILAANETKQTTIIGLLQTEATTLADTKALLATAIANGADPVALQGVVDKMTTDGEAMDAAIASVAAAPPATISGGADTTGGAASISGSTATTSGTATSISGA